MRTAVVLFLSMIPLSGEDTWYEFRLQGKHIGWSHETGEEFKEGDQVLFRTVAEGTGWFGDQEFRWRTEYVETPEGKPLRLANEAWQGEKTRSEIHGEPDGAGMKFVVVEGGKVAGEVRDEGFLFPLGTRLLAKAKGFVPGTEYGYRSFDVEEKKVVTVEAKVVGDAELTLPEGPVKAHLVKQTQIGERTYPFEVHYDDDGNVLSLNGTDIQMVLIRSTRERATAVPGHEK